MGALYFISLTVLFVIFVTGKSTTIVDDPNDGILWNITYQLNESYDVYGEVRMFHVAYPRVNVYKDVPVLIFFHGGFGSGKSGAEGTGFTPVATSAGFLMVYGEGVWGRWSAGSCCGNCSKNSSYSCYIDDVEYVGGVLDALVDEGLMAFDSAVFVTGHSNGAFMTYRLACELGDRIDGFAPAAGSPGYYNADECLYSCGEDDVKLCYNTTATHCAIDSWMSSLPMYYHCDKSHAIPVISFQGNLDEHILIDGGKCVDDRKCHGNMSIVPYDFEYPENARINSCDLSGDAEAISVRTFYNVSDENPEDYSECWTYVDCQVNTTYCIQNDGGHSWPGKTYTACDVNSDQYDATRCWYQTWLNGPQIESLMATDVTVGFFQNILAREDSTTTNSDGSEDKLRSAIIVVSIVVSVLIVVVIVAVVYLYDLCGMKKMGKKNRMSEMKQNLFIANG